MRFFQSVRERPESLAKCRNIFLSKCMYRSFGVMFHRTHTAYIQKGKRSEHAAENRRHRGVCPWKYTCLLGTRNLHLFFCAFWRIQHVLGIIESPQVCLSPRNCLSMLLPGLFAFRFSAVEGRQRSSELSRAKKDIKHEVQERYLLNAEEIAQVRTQAIR